MKAGFKIELEARNEISGWFGFERTLNPRHSSPAWPRGTFPFPFPIFPKAAHWAISETFYELLCSNLRGKKKRLKEQLVHQAAQSSSTELFIAANSYKK